MSLDIYLECESCGHYEDSFNITHNLTAMADLAGLYTVLWCPEENGYLKAADIIDPLMRGIRDLENEPELFKKLNPENGWGTYESFLKFCKKLLEKCNENPNLKLSVSR